MTVEDIEQTLAGMGTDNDLHYVLAITGMLWSNSDNIVIHDK